MLRVGVFGEYILGLMLPFLRGAFLLGTIWDFATSFLGIAGIFGVTNFRNVDVSTIGICVTAVVGSLIILGLSLSSDEIWSRDKNLEGTLFRTGHFIAVLFDGYTSFLGTAQNVILRGNRSVFTTIGVSEVVEQIGIEEIGILLILTFLITASPIMVARLPKRY